MPGVGNFIDGALCIAGGTLVIVSSCSAAPDFVTCSIAYAALAGGIVLIGKGVFLSVSQPLRR